MMFRDQVGVLAGWFKGWNECEQTVALLSLLKRVNRSQARFLQLCLEHSLSDCTELRVLENEANSPAEREHVPGQGVCVRTPGVHLMAEGSVHQPGSGSGTARCPDRSPGLRRSGVCSPLDRDTHWVTLGRHGLSVSPPSPGCQEEKEERRVFGPTGQTGCGGSRTSKGKPGLESAVVTSLVKGCVGHENGLNAKDQQDAALPEHLGVAWGMGNLFKPEG
ncbi:hypothetical protein EYD10_03031 [Varanus komodoensis]|nr:hypothetical protein EYD10_03031 [Varanus komodoensis]